MSRCLNCDTPPAGTNPAFCSACGQRSVHGRLHWRDLVRDINAQLLEWNLPWQRTVLELTLRPGETARAYVEGRRARFVNPIKYAFYAMLIAVLLVGGSLDPLVHSDVSGWRRALATNLPLFLLLMSPASVVSLRVAFWRTRYNLVEISVLVLFLTGQLALFLVVIGQIARLLPATLWPVEVLLALVVPIIYALYACANFFDARLDHAVIAALLAMTVPLVIAANIWVRLAGLK